jgi:hypothetical protein
MAAGLGMSDEVPAMVWRLDIFFVGSDYHNSVGLPPRCSTPAGITRV